MARPRNIQKKVETDFFQNVTPLWVRPDSQPVADRYNDAVDALAEWIGPDWPSNEKSNFFLMRHTLVRSCESWKSHNWDADAAWIAERRTDARHIGELDRTFEKFAAALNKAPFRHKKRMLGLAFLAEFLPEQDVKMTNAEGIAAVDRAVEWFRGSLKGRDRAYARYGAIEYSTIPRQLPRREVAVALSLADQITFWRRDGFSEGTLHCPHRPSISKNLPWKAIALFVSANCEAAEDILDSATIQTLVTSLAQKVALVHWRGDEDKN
jgi:hypothetical protein